MLNFLHEYVLLFIMKERTPNVIFKKYLLVAFYIIIAILWDPIHVVISYFTVTLRITFMSFHFSYNTTEITSFF